MFKLILISVLAVHATYGTVFKPNDSSYCGNRELCPFWEHINCNNDHTVKCASTTKLNQGQYAGVLYRLTDDEKQMLVDMHNFLRGKLASGNLENFPSATRMSKVSWDSELEESAILNAKACNFDHDCHNTPNYPNGAQNLGYETKYESDFKVMPIAQSIIKSWYSENLESNQNYMKSFDSLPNGFHEHFATMVKEDNNRIGCAIMVSKEMFMSNEFNRVDLVCNYNHLLMINEPVYDFGPPTSKCPNGVDTKFRNLCI